VKFAVDPSFKLCSDADRCARHPMVLGVWHVSLVRQRLRLLAFGVAHLNFVWPASRIPLPQVNHTTSRMCVRLCDVAVLPEDEDQSDEVLGVRHAAR
jgi:hypothetical protein